MKKIVLLFICLISINTSLYTMDNKEPKEYSIADYIREHGMPVAQNGITDLSKKGITSLEGMEQLANALTINLSHNKIKKLPKHLFYENDFNNICTLDLGHNEIEEIPDEVFDRLLNLKNLGLRSNNIDTISEKALLGTRNLETISLAENKVRSLPNKLFKHLERLQRINFRNNYLNSNQKEFIETYGLSENVKVNLAEQKLIPLLTKFAQKN